MKKIGPYVGITGFMHLREVVVCNNAFREATAVAAEHVAKNLKFMVGVLVSSKTLAGGTNRWPNRYPPMARIPEIISMKHEEHLLHTIHYNTDDAGTIDEQVDQVMAIAPKSIDAIQLNIRWVSPVKMQRVRRKYPDLRIILQIGSGALADVDEPGEIFLGEALRAYEGVADDFLVDPSGGKGEPLNVWRTFACIADDEIPQSMQPNIAGGFNGDNVFEARGLMRRLRRPVGIDAEGRLRTRLRTPMTGPEDADGGDHLDLVEATYYLQKGVALVGGAIKPA